MSYKKIGIGIVGLGTVGAGLIEIIRKNKNLYKNKYPMGIKFQVFLNLLFLDMHQLLAYQIIVKNEKYFFHHTFYNHFVLTFFLVKITII